TLSTRAILRWNCCCDQHVKFTTCLKYKRIPIRPMEKRCTRLSKWSWQSLSEVNTILAFSQPEPFAAVGHPSSVEGIVLPLMKEHGPSADRTFPFMFNS